MKSFSTSICFKTTISTEKDLYYNLILSLFLTNSTEHYYVLLIKNIVYSLLIVPDSFFEDNVEYNENTHFLVRNSKVLHSFYLKYNLRVPRYVNSEMIFIAYILFRVMFNPTESITLLSINSILEFFEIQSYLDSNEAVLSAMNSINSLNIINNTYSNSYKLSFLHLPEHYSDLLNNFRPCLNEINSVVRIYYNLRYVCLANRHC